MLECVSVHVADLNPFVFDIGRIVIPTIICIP